jgi:hypothetical protein
MYFKAGINSRKTAGKYGIISDSALKETDKMGITVNS